MFPATARRANSGGRQLAATRIGIFRSQAVFAAALALCTFGSALAQDVSSLAAAAAMERLVVDAIERAEKSVVAIARVQKDEPAAAAAVGDAPLIGPRLFDRLEPTDPRFVPSEFGSGVVIDAKGLVLTNYHVLGNVRQADFFVWSGRRPFRATVKAADPWLDLAVLQIEGSTSFKPIPLGEARGLKKGQFVIALGNPYAIARDGQPSASWGIIANLERQAPSPNAATRGSDGRETLHHYGTLIQTDVRLDLGASGGALINLKGEMIGLTTSLAALAGYERAGGFAIPVDNDFRRAVETLKAGRLPDYGLLGVEPAALALNPRQQGLRGARIRSVADAMPARLADLREGDIITQVEGQPVADDLDLIRRISGKPAGSQVSLQILRGATDRRGGRPMTVSVRLSKKRLTSPREGYAENPPRFWRGLRVEYAAAAPLFVERSRELDPQGCLGVVEVRHDSAAWRAGLRAGDFLSHVGATRVTTPQEFFDAVEPLKGDVTLRLTATEPDRTTRTVPQEETQPR